MLNRWKVQEIHTPFIVVISFCYIFNLFKDNCGFWDYFRRQLNSDSPVLCRPVPGHPDQACGPVPLSRGMGGAAGC
jgi:hypothetical protein